MEDYIAKTIRAYKDTETYEQGTRELVPTVELDQFLALLKPDSHVLDAGCAYGRDTDYIKQRGFTTEAFDLSPELIARAKELYPRLSFKVADVRETGYGDSTFNGIWCNATLLHLNDDDMRKALTEFHRILKTGGVLAVSLKKGEGTQEFIETFSSKSERFFNFKTHESFLEMLEEAGFIEKAWHYINERERFGQDKRDLDWLYTFSVKI